MVQRLKLGNQDFEDQDKCIQKGEGKLYQSFKE